MCDNNTQRLQRENEIMRKALASVGKVLGCDETDAFSKIEALISNVAVEAFQISRADFLRQTEEMSSERINVSRSQRNGHGEVYEMFEIEGSQKPYKVQQVCPKSGKPIGRLWEFKSYNKALDYFSWEQIQGLTGYYER